MADLTKATPRPWHWDSGDIGTAYSHRYCQITNDDQETIIADVNDLFDAEIGAANAAIIVQAVNSYDAMREALKAAQEALEFYADPFDEKYLTCVNGHDRCEDGASRKCPYCERPSVPDFYDEMDFGELANAALAKIKEATDG